MVCAQYCPYHKPERNEEFECRAFTVARRFIEAGTKVPHAKPERSLSPGSGIADALRERICNACSFFEADCDFISTGGKAHPCGGLTLISHLVRSGVITIDEVTDMISLV